MLVRETTQVLITIEMTEEESLSLRTALMKMNEARTTLYTEQTFSKEEVEIMDNLRLSLLNL